MLSVQTGASGEYSLRSQITKNNGKWLRKFRFTTLRAERAPFSFELYLNFRAKIQHCVTIWYKICNAFFLDVVCYPYIRSDVAPHQGSLTQLRPLLRGPFQAFSRKHLASWNPFTTRLIEHEKTVVITQATFLFLGYVQHFWDTLHFDS